jgi:integrase/recombinase XerD
MNLPIRATNTDSLAANGFDSDSQLGQLTALWLLTKRSQHTRRCYKRDLTVWVTWCLENQIQPLKARMSQVDAWIICQRSDGLAETSIARRVSAVSSWYTYLIRNTADDVKPLVTRNPARTDARPSIDPDESPTIGLSRAETDRLLAAADADGSTSAALIRLLLVTGIRVGSAIDAKIEDLAYDAGHRTLVITVKRGKRRRTVVPPSASTRIDTMLADRGEPEDGPLFTTSAGKPIYQMYVYRLVRRLARQAKIPTANEISPHSLRHTAITEFLNASGGDLRRAQDFAHHADPRTTRRYDRARNSLDQHGAYVLGDRFA